MKKITLLWILLISTISISQNAPITFENGEPGSTWTWTTFENGSNPAVEILPNPDPSGANTSATVAKFTALQSGQPFAGFESSHGAGIGTFTLTAANATVRIMVWKSVISDVGIKFATSTNASTGEIKVANTLVNQWEELVFDFSSKIGETNDQIIIFPDFQNGRTSDNICFIDNIVFGLPVINPLLPTLPLDFESSTLTYSFTDFGGAVTTKIANPDMSGINTSANVAQLTKNVGAEVWAGSFIELGTPIDFSSSQSIKIKTWSPQSGITVKLKLENLANPAINTEVDVVNTVAGAWEELTFNFPGIVNANNYQRVVVFFNFGVSGNGNSYYFDSIQTVTNQIEGVTLPLTFESSTLTYSFTDFGGAVAEKIANPDMSGINTSENVARLTKNTGAEVWAGSFIELVSPIDFSNSQVIKVKTWSPQSGITVKLKLENLANPNISTEVDVVNTVSGAWEELTFTFPGIVNANNYQRVVIFFNFGVSGNGNSYYFDDIQTVESVVEGVTLPLDFESTTLTYNFTNFGGATTQKIANPDASGINTSGNVARLNKNAGSEIWAGSFIELSQPIDFSSSESIKIKTWAPQSGIVVKLKLENLANPAINVEVDVVNTVANQWEELTFNFPGIANANNYQRVVVFFNFGQNGTGENYYFDDIQIGTNLSLVSYEEEKTIVYPNPTSSIINIRSEFIADEIAIYNLSGQLIKSVIPTEQESQINIDQLNAGVYIIQTRNQNSFKSIRFIKL